MAKSEGYSSRCGRGKEQTERVQLVKIARLL